MLKPKSFYLAILISSFFGLNCRPVAGQQSSINKVSSKKEKFFSPLPSEYESWSACAKQDFLWKNKIEPSKYDENNFPKIDGPDVANLAWATLTKHLKEKMDRVGDQAPSGWIKPIHRRGAVAKVAFTGALNSDKTGLFKGASCGLFRASLTSAPKADEFNPGFAWKVFVAGKPSRNVSSLVSLDGQGGNFNFFHNFYSNIVPPSERLSSRIVKIAFETVSKHAHKIGVDEFAEVDSNGAAVASPRAPRQLVFVPGSILRKQFSSSVQRDFRADLLKIPVGTVLFQVFGVSQIIEDEDWKSFVKSGAEDTVLPKSWEPLGELSLKSEFVVSEWGDDGLFFRHERYNKE